MNGKRLSKTYVVVFLAVICCILWGSATPTIKVGYTLFRIESGDTMSRILFAGIRFTLAGILTIIFGSVGNGGFLLPGKKSFRMVLMLALFQTVIQYVLFYLGLANTTGTKGAIISGMASFFAVLISCLIFRMEKLTLLKVIGCIVGFAGIVVLNLSGDFTLDFKASGEGALILATVSYALSSVLIKKYSKYENPVTLSGWQFVAGGLAMTAAAYALGGRLNPGNGRAWLLILYLAFVSATAYSLWGLLLKYNSVSRITTFSFLTPVFGVILSIVLLNESINALQCVTALVLVCTGIILVNRSQDRNNDSTV